MDGVGHAGMSSFPFLNISGSATKWQQFLDRITPHPVGRWVFFAFVALLYAVRVYFLRGFYIVTYGLGIYTLNLLIGFLTPQGMTADEPDGPALPTKGDEEFKPFVRKLPEFKFWYAMAKAVCTALTMTFFSFFDIPVFWPILLMYWVLLFGMTMKKQIKHMIKHKYVPFTFGKKSYGAEAKSSK